MAELTLLYQRGYTWSEGEDITAAKLNLDPTFTLVGTINTVSIGVGAVTEPKLGTGAVSTRALADASVTEPKIADGAVTEPKHATGGVSTRALADGSVTLAKTDLAMVGATPSENGTSGLVPQPLSGDSESFLRGDATWQPFVSDFVLNLFKFQQYA